MPVPQLTVEQLTSYWTQARDAYHKLCMGQTAAEVTDQNGEKVRFTPARKADLYAYIQELERQIALLESGAPVNTPARFFF